MKYYCDDMRHLICVPYTEENLHKMAEDLDIKRCWFHKIEGKSHYDIPKRRIEEIMSKVNVISPKEIVEIMREAEEAESELSELKFFKSEEFRKAFADQVNKDTWEQGLPKIYMNDEGQIVKHWKDRKIEVLKNGQDG